MALGMYHRSKMALKIFIKNQTYQQFLKVEGITMTPGGELFYL